MDIGRTLLSIKKHNLIFISVQPDIPYFHWQTKLYLYQFSKYNIQDYCYCVFGFDYKPSEEIKKLAKEYNVKWYRDTRKDKSYIPSIRPHLLKKFFKDYPDLGKNVFYHDSDILFTRLPKFELLLDNKIAYLSDTVGYIGYEYIEDCCKRYKSKYSNLGKLHLFKKMCKKIDIKPQLVKKNQINSGGAQYLLKDIDYKYWAQCEKDEVKLYNFFKRYSNSWRIFNNSI